MRCSLHVTLCGLSLAIAPPVLADTATISLSGRVLPGTCTLAAPAIVLDQLRIPDAQPGDNRLRPGALTFTGCVGVNKAVLSFDGTAATGDPSRWHNSAGADAADGVTVALLRGATGNTYLKKGDAGIELPVSGTTASFPLRAGYYVRSAAAVKPGAVKAAITVTADYQ